MTDRSAANGLKSRVVLTFIVCTYIPPHSIINAGEAMRKLIKLSLVCIFAFSLLCACGESESAVDISQYIESFKAMDYKATYSFTAPAVKINEKDFIKKHENIFSGLTVKEIIIENLKGPDEQGVFTYDATYKTKDYGDFKSSFKLKSGFKDGKCVVLWDYSLIFPEMEEHSSVRVKTLRAKRGEIFGADGTLIAENSFADTVYMDVAKVKDISAVAEAAMPVTGTTHAELVNMFNSAVENDIAAVPLGSFFKGQLDEQQRESLLAVPGLGIDDKMYTPIRNYPLKEAAAHIAGYIGLVDKDNVPEGYSDTDKTGKTGLELAYDQLLRGKDGKIICIENRWGDNIRTLYEVKCEQGQDLWLTVKPGMQKRAYNALTEHLTEEQTGVAIVMDADTGFVEAMASHPSYDDNMFTFPIPKDVWDKLSKDKRNPLFPWATQGGYPPGSVIKPFTATAALEAGAVTPDTVFDGVIVNDTWKPDDDWNWRPIKRVENSGTPLKLSNAMLHSDNIYFAFAAMRLGGDKLIEYLDRIGMEQPAPFDLPVKQANIKNEDRDMDRRLLAEMGYGQGDLIVTPLQLASMYTAFANGTGDIMRPILVEKTRRTDGLEYETVTKAEPEAWIKDAVSKSSLNKLLPLMEDVMKKRGGTGRPANIPGIGLAGKTGTAEIGGDKSREISWIAAFWTDGNYKRLVIVMVDTAAELGSVKFKIAKELLTP